MNLSYVLRQRASMVDKGITLISSGGAEEFLSYTALYDQALQTLFHLQERNVRPQDELVFQLDDSKSFLIVFWACLLGGIIPVPLSVANNEERRKKLVSVWRILNNPYLITTKKQLDRLRSVKESQTVVPDELFRRGILDEVVLEGDKNGDPYDAHGDDIAFIQFSSGSTGDPKGVVLTHKNLLTNIEAITNAAGYTDGDSMISWMPLTHDMGLIGFHLNPLVCGINQYLIPTEVFIRRPSLWFDKASEHKVSVLCSPNFGYKYLMKHNNSDELYGWDLSSVRIIYNGAEPISDVLCKEFITYLSKYQLKENVMRPVYGLAEASLAVSISKLNEDVISYVLDRNHLGIGDQIVQRTDDKNGVSFVNVGRSIKNCELRIVADDDTVLPDRIIGHIQIKGGNVTSGYYNNTAATSESLTKDGWLRTGDLGFLIAGELYVTGRKKDIIFVNGQNFYPHDIERIAEKIPGVELNKIVVAGFFDNVLQRDEIVAFLHYKGDVSSFVTLATTLKSVVNSEIGLEINKVIPVNEIPKTTSGKLQRFKLLERLHSGFYQQSLDALERLKSTLDFNKEVLPEYSEEQTLLHIWRTVLQNHALTVTDRFTESGGNSLKAAEISMLVLKKMNHDLSIETIYEAETVQQLAQEIRALKNVQYLPIPVNEIRGSYPLSSAQKRLYYSWEGDKYSVAYNIPVSLTFEGNLNADKMEGCIVQLIYRHDVFRMVFEMNSDPQIKLVDDWEFKLETKTCTPESLDYELRNLVRPFDLSKVPLLRCCILDTGIQQVLFLDFHHIISDGISVYNFLRELMLLYRGVSLEELTISYTDFCIWEKSKFTEQYLYQKERYWTHLLQEPIPVLELPTDFPRPLIFNREGAKLHFSFTKESQVAFKQNAKRWNCSPTVLAFAVYNLLLAKHTQQRDIIVGVPVSGRTHPDLLPLQGMFVNNLALRTIINKEESFEQFLLKTIDNFSDALSNQDYPFELIVKHLSGKRDVSRNPIFDTMFIYQNMGFPESSDREFSIRRNSFDPGFSKFDLSLEIFDSEEDLVCALEYSTGLFNNETINKIAADFDDILTKVLLDPSILIAELLVIGTDEFERYVKQYNDTDSTYPREKTVCQLFMEQVELVEKNPCLELGDRLFDYGQVDSMSNALAIELRGNGIGSGVVVGIIMDRSAEFIVSILAVHKAGGAYLPIEANLPEERIAYILNDSCTKLVLTTAHHQTMLVDLLKGNGKDSLSILEVDCEDLLSAPQNKFEEWGKSEDLAYVIYTSGTTGWPKGVMIEHRSLTNYIYWAAKTYVREPACSFPLYTSISFDLTITSIFTALVTGNKIVLYPDDNDLVLNTVVKDNKSTVIKLTPSHLRLLLGNKYLPANSENKIKRFVVGGEALDTQLTKDIFNQFEGRVEIYNEYGPTEATVGCMIHLFDPREITFSVAIGKPIANTQIYVLDPFLAPLPHTIPGEIYIGGDGVAKGYLYNEELTNKKFIPNPFKEGTKLYKTGDIARRLPNGFLEFVGRSDHQVKINGYRIELTEIEHSLRLHQGIHDALVIVKKNSHQRSILLAYYKADNVSQSINERSLRAHLAERLPHYMIPAYFIEIDQVPLTRNGKVDFDSLPSPVVGLIDQKAESEIEIVLLKIWEETLGQKDLMVTDNFFELGGDSIKAVQISARMNEKRLTLEVKDILAFQTVQQISHHVKVLDETSRYQQGWIEGEVGLTPITSWFFLQDFNNPDFYNQSIFLRLPGQVDRYRMERSFRNLLHLHDELRLNYDSERRSLYYNPIHRPENFSIEHITISEQSEVEEVCERCRASFDIKKDLLIRALWIHQVDRPDTLFITAHHLLMDGVSWRILLKDLYTGYKESYVVDQTYNNSVKTASLIDWYNRLSLFTVSSTASQYWENTEQIAFSVPQDFTTSDWTIKNRKRFMVSLNKEQTDVLLRKGHSIYKSDASVLLNTALLLTIAEWTGRHEVVFEHENHGRHLDGIDVSKTLGWFTALYPVTLHVTGKSLDDNIKAVKEQLKKVPDRGISYGILKFLLKGKKQKGLPLSELRFNYLGQIGDEMNNDLFYYDAQQVGFETDKRNQMTTKLEWNSMILGGTFTLDLLYNDQAHSEETIKFVADLFKAHLLEILQHIAGSTDVYFTPSDFEEAGLDQQEIDALFE